MTPLLCLLLACPQIDDLFEAPAGANVPGGSFIVIRNGKVVCKGAHGLANVEKRIRNTTRTNFRLASMTKQFTAMAVMILADRGKLSFDDPASRFFPELPAWARRMSVRHLLNHTSGIMPYEPAAPSIPPGKVTPRDQLQDRDVLEILKKQERTLFEPGAQYRYSNSGYVLLGLLVERASGLSFPEFLRKEIFDPLRMKGSVAHQEAVAVVRNRAYGYSKRGDGFRRTDQSVTSATLGDGGIYTSVEDLLKWDRALAAHRLVKEETWRQAVTPGALNNGSRTEYGFGWEIASHRGRRLWRHSGTTVGFNSYIARFPDDRLTVIVLLNRTDLKPSEIVFEIAGRYLDARP